MRIRGLTSASAVFDLVVFLASATGQFFRHFCRHLFACFVYLADGFDVATDRSCGTFGVRKRTNSLYSFAICWKNIWLEGRCFYAYSYFSILVTTPAPTVLTPSRIANRKTCSIDIGCSNLTLKVTVSPGITISLSAGSSTSPVTSVVRK